MKTSPAFFIHALTLLLSAVCAAGNVAKVSAHGEMAAASPFDVTFSHAKQDAADSRTQLLHQGNAHMPYRQSTNGSTPSGWIQLGTPRKWLFVIFDTGSDKLVAKTWETVAAELSTIDQGIQGMVGPSGLIYDHNSSTSYHRKFIMDVASGSMKPKQSGITYGSGTAITDEGTESVLVGNRSLENFTLMEITADSLQLLHTSKGIAGILGLQHMKNKSLGNSLFSRMRDANLLSSFGYCRGTGNNGTFIWGDNSDEGQEITVIGQMHWAMKLEKVQVPTVPADSNASDDGSSLLEVTEKAPYDPVKMIKKILAEPFTADDGGAGQADSDSDDASRSSAEDQRAEEKLEHDIEKEAGKILKAIGEAGLGDEHAAKAEARDENVVLADLCSTEKCTAILDTGSNIIAGPTEAMNSITKLVNVKTDCSNFDQLPHIKINIDGMPLSIPPSGYVMKVPMPSWAGGAAGGMGGGDGDGGDGDGDSEGFFGQDVADAAAAERAFHDVVIEVLPGHVHRHRPLEMGSLAEQKASSHRARTNRRWKAVFDRLHKSYGVDLRQQVHALLHDPDQPTSDQFLCMPALVPLDKKTEFGPLWIVGTPLLDAYYARWSFGKGDGASPKIHLKALQDAQVCKSVEPLVPPTTALMRKDRSDAEKDRLPEALSLSAKRGPSERLPEEIAYPHWAKDLLHI